MSMQLSSSPYIHSGARTNRLMRDVMLATIPGILVQFYYFGWGNLVQIAMAMVFALVLEALALTMRRRPVRFTLSDNSALLTGLLIGLCLPPFTPWWITLIGVFFAIVVAKHLYGGLGQNLFNPAMVAYVVLLISFPVQMTLWPAANGVTSHMLSLQETLRLIFTGYSLEGFNASQMLFEIDGYTLATPLDSFTSGFSQALTSNEVLQGAHFDSIAGVGWWQLNLAYLLGGIWLLRRKVIRWHIPVGILGSLTLWSTLYWLFNQDQAISPLMHLLSGATMLGAFFIATDPVSAASTDRARLYFAFGIGTLVFLIRTFGAFPDAFAFAVLLMNMAVPLLEYYVRPRVYGHELDKIGQDNPAEKGRNKK